MKNLLLTAILFQSLCVQALTDDISTMTASVIGEAYSLENKALLYRELHYYSDDKNDHVVVYVDENNNEIVKKTIDYRASYSAPAFKQVDKRNNEILAVEWVDEQLKIAYQPKFKDELKEAVIKPEYPLVIDAGFDYFVREYWNELLAGERIKFKYVAPTRLTLVGLTIQSKTCSTDFIDDSIKGEENKNLDQYSCFQIKASQWLIGLFLKPINLMYSTNEQRLYRFRGLANINDEKGDGLEVDIRYSY